MRIRVHSHTIVVGTFCTQTVAFTCFSPSSKGQVALVAMDFRLLIPEDKFFVSRIKTYKQEYDMKFLILVIPRPHVQMGVGSLRKRVSIKLNRRN
jgi:hypothetical protein